MSKDQNLKVIEGEVADVIEGKRKLFGTRTKVALGIAGVVAGVVAYKMLTSDSSNDEVLLPITEETVPDPVI